MVYVRHVYLKLYPAIFRHVAWSGTEQSRRLQSVVGYPKNMRDKRGHRIVVGNQKCLAGQKQGYGRPIREETGPNEKFGMNICLIKCIDAM